MKLNKQKIIEIMESVFKQKQDSITASTKVEDFARDSMDVMEFFAILDRKYNISLEPEKISGLRTAGEVIDYILKDQDASTS